MARHHGGLLQTSWDPAGPRHSPPPALGKGRPHVGHQVQSPPQPPSNPPWPPKRQLHSREKEEKRRGALDPPMPLRLATYLCPPVLMPPERREKSRKRKTD